jgi:carbonic anhydrase
MNGSLLMASALVTTAFLNVQTVLASDPGHGAVSDAPNNVATTKVVATSKVFGSSSFSHGASSPDASSHGNGAKGHVVPASPGGDKHASAKASHSGGAHWGYAGAGGPSQWGDVKSEYATCKTGRMQSPIDVRSSLVVGVSKISFNYKVSELALWNNGHTVQVDYASGSAMTVGGKAYKLLQFHFHTPSEHLVDGKRYPLEMHLVHKSDDGTLAVAGVMIAPGAANIALEEIWGHLPRKAGEKKQVDRVAINARDLLPDTDSYRHYKGSLTTPPCSEGVRWFVLDRPIKASARQISTIAGIMGANARPSQPLNERLVISAQ